MERFNSVAKMSENGEIFKKVVFNAPIIKLGKKELLGGQKRYVKVSEEEKLRVTKSRAKNKVRDYVMANGDLDYFATYTLSPELVEDRYDERKIYDQVKYWLRNNVSREGLKYVLVPEGHEDGAWHFHGFTNKDLEWKYGFSKVVDIRRSRDRQQMVSYSTSYINKNGKKFNGRYYLHSNNLKEPDKIYYNLDFESQEGYCVEIGQTGFEAKIVQ